jgi:hypothetical protein
MMIFRNSEWWTASSWSWIVQVPCHLMSVEQGLEGTPRMGDMFVSTVGKVFPGMEEKGKNHPSCWTWIGKSLYRHRSYFKVIVTKTLLHSWVPTEDYPTLEPKVKVHTGPYCLLRCELEDRAYICLFYSWRPKLRSSHLCERSQHILRVKLYQVSQDWEVSGHWE